MKQAQYWISKYDLEPHPEGGYFKEIYASPVSIDKTCLPEGFPGNHKLATSIYFLLEGTDVSKLHRLRSDELWYHHQGGGLEILVITPEHELKWFYLGADYDAGERLQVIIPAGSIFGSRIKDTDTYALMGCMVAPGFDFEDFEMPSRKELLLKYPEFEEEITAFTNP